MCNIFDRSDGIGWSVGQIVDDWGKLGSKVVQGGDKAKRKDYLGVVDRRGAASGSLQKKMYFRIRWKMYGSKEKKSFVG